ncbi:MAG: HAMP domain-containing histidine kinase [Oscillospiraceae bacterium]|nr:HAMP domain-containing histidine kinase [Oscillospiraceae bacterium]
MNRHTLEKKWKMSVFLPVVITVGTMLIAICASAAFLILSDFGKAMPDMQKIIFLCIVTVVLGAVLVLVALWFSRRATKPITDALRDIMDFSKKIADGSYGIQLEKTREDELGNLVDSLNRMSEEIARSEKLQTEFISSVSHELRTPLTAITGWAETLAYDDSMSGDSRRGIEIILKEANRLTKMVSELLEFTRIQGGRFNLDIEKIDVASELEDAIFTYGELLKRDHIDLEYTPTDDEIPMLDADGERLKQVFLNLIDNAAKHGREGGRIAVGIQMQDEDVVITVRDFGRGIPENELPHVKEKFYKGSSRERGSGIGLAVCDEIIMRHGGTMTIENATDGGVLASILLPLKSKKS